MGQIENREKRRQNVGRGTQGQNGRCSFTTLHRALGVAAFLLGCSSSALHVEGDLLFNGEKAYELLKTQTDFGPRYSGTQAHIKMRDWLVRQAKQHTEKVSLQEFQHTWSMNGKRLTMYNIIADMDFKAQKRILLIAHWDTRPTADQELDSAKRTKAIPGANDGASGVAVLLELMRAFKQTPPPVNVTFLFVDGEDLGPGSDDMFLGAKYFAKNTNPRHYAYGILLDMVGDKNLRIPKESFSMYYAASLVERFYAHAAKIGLAKYFPNTSQSWISDDHVPLNEAGIPTMDLIDFEYPHWHTLNDTPDQCSPDSLAVVGRAVESFLRSEK